MEDNNSTIHARLALLGGTFGLNQENFSKFQDFETIVYNTLSKAARDIQATAAFMGVYIDEEHFTFALDDLRSARNKFCDSARLGLHEKEQFEKNKEEVSVFGAQGSNVAYPK